MLTCKLDEFVNDFGFPMPEVDVDLQGIDDISSVSGVISWGDTRVVSEGADSSPGPVTRSHSVSTTSEESVKVQTPHQAQLHVLSPCPLSYHPSI